MLEIHLADIIAIKNVTWALKSIEGNHWVAGFWNLCLGNFAKVLGLQGILSDKRCGRFTYTAESVSLLVHFHNSSGKFQIGINYLFISIIVPERSIRHKLLVHFHNSSGKFQLGINLDLMSCWVANQYFFRCLMKALHRPERRNMLQETVCR